MEPIPKNIEDFKGSYPIPAFPTFTYFPLILIYKEARYLGNYIPSSTLRL